MSTTSDLVYPKKGSTETMMASVFRWGRIIGRVNLGAIRRELSEMPRTILVTSDTTGRSLRFEWNGLMQPFVRGKHLPPYAEWKCASEDFKLSKLKIHAEGIGFKKS